MLFDRRFFSFDHRIVTFFAYAFYLFETLAWSWIISLLRNYLDQIIKIADKAIRNEHTSYSTLTEGLAGLITVVTLVMVAVTSLILRIFFIYGFCIRRGFNLLRERIFPDEEEMAVNNVEENHGWKKWLRIKLAAVLESFAAYIISFEIPKQFSKFFALNFNIGMIFMFILFCILKHSKKNYLHNINNQSNSKK